MTGHKVQLQPLKLTKDSGTLGKILGVFCLIQNQLFPRAEFYNINVVGIREQTGKLG